MFFNLHLESDVKECIQGFPGVLVIRPGNGNNFDTTITLLIPEMNFSCNATIFGFTVAGSLSDLLNEPHYKILSLQSTTK